MSRRVFALMALLLTLCAPAVAAPKPAVPPKPAPLFLHNGDTVVFYGDSITEQQTYARDVETYITARLPYLHVKYINSGWGGDRVTGGGGGPIDLRLTRDVVNYHPTVVTVFLGMNDGGYAPYDEARFQTYAQGLTHIVDSLTKQLPGVRLTLLTPSFYDKDAPRANHTSVYNATLVRYGAFVKQLGAQRGIPVADTNAPMLAATLEGRKTDPHFALSDDGVHPNEVGHAIIAAALLHAWNAPPPPKPFGVYFPLKHFFTLAEAVPYGKSMSWVHSFTSPLPMPWPVPEAARPAFVVSPLARNYNYSVLGVLGNVGKSATRYTLLSDAKPLGIVTLEQSKPGIDLTQFPDLPQNKQAQAVLDSVNARITQWHTLWKGNGSNGLVRANDTPTDDELARLRAADASLDPLRAQARAAALPVPHTLALQPVSP